MENFIVLLELQIREFLDKANAGEATLSDEIVDQFAEDCKTAIRRQFDKRRGYSVRMSGLGRPVCQQKMERDGYEEEKSYNDILRFLFGDVVEAIVMAVMRGAGVNIVDTQTKVTTKIGDRDIDGTLDVAITDEHGGTKVWDIKSASDYSFTNKFSKGYRAIESDDPFGYIMQGHLYAEGYQAPFGGWIAVNKSSGEIAIVEADYVEEEHVAELDKAKQILKKLEGPVHKKPPYDSIEEKGTRNRLLPKPCTFCGFKKHCWKNLELHPKVTSRAKFPPQVWYTKLVDRGV
jgi:hypothetical protein